MSVQCIRRHERKDTNGRPVMGTFRRISSFSLGDLSPPVSSLAAFEAATPTKRFALNLARDLMLNAESVRSSSSRASPPAGVARPAAAGPASCSGSFGVCHPCRVWGSQSADRCGRITCGDRVGGVDRTGVDSRDAENRAGDWSDLLGVRFRTLLLDGDSSWPLGLPEPDIADQEMAIGEEWSVPRAHFQC